MAIPICFKNEESIINKENIWEGDLFNRKELASIYTKLIQSIIQPYVVSINSSYGSGKTFFLKRWAEELRQNKESVVFFNAWDCDFVEKPLLPFLYNFLQQLKEQGLVKYNFKEDIKNCGDITVTCLKNFIDVASSGIINIDDLKEKTDAHAIKLPKISTLEEYKQLQDALYEFKSGLNEIVKRLKGKNLYIFIDELERCRPTFAIELLEAIKHLFNIKGLVFILGIDRNQLKHTISNIYGCGMDGEGYLRRFIDIELELPQPNIKDYSNYLNKKFEIENKSTHAYRNWIIGYSEFLRFWEIFSELYDFQLREVEQIFVKFNAITKILDEKIIKITPVLALLMILKIKDPVLYNNFTLDKLTEQNANDFLTKNFFSKLKNAPDEIIVNDFVKICMALHPTDYRLLSYKVQDKTKENFYSELSKMQQYVQSCDIDRVQYLKNMISCISLIP